MRDEKQTPKTRQEYIALAELQMKNSFEMCESFESMQMSIEEHLGVTSYILILSLRALTHATLAQSAPAPATPANEDTHAFALLVALVSVIDDYLQDKDTYNAMDFSEVFERAKAHIQASKTNVPPTPESQG